MPGRMRRPAALIDDPGMPGEHELERDATPAKRVGRPRKATGAAADPAKRPGRKPGTVKITAARTPGGQVMSKQQMMDTVAGELGMLMTLGVGVLELRDPDAAAVFEEPISLGRLGQVDPIEGVVDRMVALLARNDKALAYAAKGGVMTDILVLSFLVGTLGKRMYQVGAQRREDGMGGLDGDRYPAYEGAAA